MNIEKMSDTDIKTTIEYLNIILHARQQKSDYYKFKYGDKVSITSCVGGIIPATVLTVYTSTVNDHSAHPHKRCVVLCDYEGSQNTRSVMNQIHDVAEIELELR